MTQIDWRTAYFTALLLMTVQALFFIVVAFVAIGANADALPSGAWLLLALACGALGYAIRQLKHLRDGPQMRSQTIRL